MTQVVSLTPKVSVSQLLRLSVMQQLHDIDTPRLDAELLLSKAMDISRVELHTYPERIVNSTEFESFQNLVRRRQNGEPMAYLLGEQEFWSLKLKVTPDVLVPRPETEHLVEAALEKIEHIEEPHVLDLGTGSGAIALAIAFERPDAIILATDQSSKALELAMLNAERFALPNIQFIQSNWYEKIDERRFDLIVSNPPYIASTDPHLSQGGLPFEPWLALTSGNSGTRSLETIIFNAPEYLLPEGWLAVEHGYDQSAVVMKMFEQRGFSHMFSRKDLAGNDRVFSGQYLFEQG